MSYILGKFPTETWMWRDERQLYGDFVHDKALEANLATANLECYAWADP